MGSAPNGNSSKDTVWAHRVYAPMHIHRPALTSYHAAIQKAFPEHAITFDVIFAAADNAVPSHCDFDSLGPFEASLGSIGQDDFITVHANLITAKESGGGQLRTLDSLMLAAVHFIANRLTGAFGSLGDQTAWLCKLAPATLAWGTPSTISRRILSPQAQAASATWCDWYDATFLCLARRSRP